MASLPARGVTGIPEEVLRKVFLSRGTPAPCCLLPPPAPHFIFYTSPVLFLSFFSGLAGGASTLAPSKVAFVRVYARHSPSCTTNHRALMQIVYRLQPFPIAPAFLILGGAHKESFPCRGCIIALSCFQTAPTQLQPLTPARCPNTSPNDTSESSAQRRAHAV